MPNSRTRDIGKGAITQEDTLGCSIACVALVCKVNYKEAEIILFKGLGNPTTKGYFCRDIVKAFARAGKEYEYKYVKKWENFKENTIVFIKRSKKYPTGHYLVKSKQGWMDSWINYPSEIKDARSGFRKKLPGKAIYAVYALD